MLKLKRNLFAVLWGVILLPLSAHAQDQGTLYKKVGQWTINQYAQSESSAQPSCSAVYAQDRLNWLRVERFNEGYLFGLNGLSRTEQGPLYDLKFWFDDDRSQELSGQAQFIKDAAYPLDDWLSYFQSTDAKPSPIEAIRGLNTMSFAFMVPGNRTGNNEVTTTFALKGSAAALLALEECYEVAASSGDVAPSASVEADTPLNPPSDCPDDGPRLPGSGVCQGRGVNYLNIAEGNAPELMEGCEWKLNEAVMPGGDYLFYLATSCGKFLSKLELSIGASTADLNLIASAMSEGADRGKIGTSIPVDDANPKASLLQFVQSTIDDKTAAGKCRIVPYFGSSDMLTIDNLSPTEAKIIDNKGDGARWACGPYGLNQESNAFWRIFSGFAWYFDLGQDAYFDIDPRSLTLVYANDLN